MTARETCLVSTAELERHLGAPGLAIVDASWYLPVQARDARAEYETGHLPGAVFFDLDALSDRANPLPHMLPRPEVFSAAMGGLGVASDADIVVYDGAGLYAAARAWWTLRAFGAGRVRVLDGGLPRWVAEGRALEAGAATVHSASFKARPSPGAVADAAAVERALREGTAQVLDARPAARFRGDAPEPRPGLRAGHMPGSLSVPFDALLEHGALKAPDALRATLAEAGVDLGKPAITTCGSGVTAAVVALALASLGVADVALYDGSWAEWGARADLPIVTGP